MFARHSSFGNSANDNSQVSMRLLLVEDDAKTAAFVVKGLKQAAFAVDHASNGVEGLP